MNIIYQARRFAHAAHDAINQKRKWTGEPYWVHTDEVAEIVFNSFYPMDYAGMDRTEVIDARKRADKMIAAAHLHDIIEDTKTTYEELRDTFGLSVAFLVLELTDVYTSERFPKLNRKERKRLEAERLGKISPDAQTIKLSDLLSNTADIIQHDKEFAKTYLAEKEFILSLMKQGNKDLYNRVLIQLTEAKEKISI